MLTPHKIDIQQGNYVDQEMVAKLKPEMTRSQVRFILGTPLVADVFHPARWDYVYLTGNAGDVNRQRRITVVFDGDKLTRIEGDIAPGENLTLAPAGAPNP
jgi:outer membrane protein assembly factor BamE